jgi:hypothetical protein
VGAKALDHFRGAGEEPVRVVDQRMAIRGQRDVRPAAKEQLGVERRLELANALRDARLAEAELPCSGVERAQPDDALEGSKLRQRHAHDRPNLSAGVTKINFSCADRAANVALRLRATWCPRGALRLRNGVRGTTGSDQLHARRRARFEEDR